MGGDGVSVSKDISTNHNIVEEKRGMRCCHVSRVVYLRYLSCNDRIEINIHGVCKDVSANHYVVEEERGTHVLLGIGTVYISEAQAYADTVTVGISIQTA